MIEKLLKKSRKFLKFLIIFLVIAGWVFSGWPQIWNNPPIPPKIEEAWAAISFVGLTSANTNVVGLPVGTVAGDLGIIVAGRANSAGPQTITGWTDLGVVGGGTGGGAHGQRLLWKLLDATDISNGSITAGSQTTEIELLVLRGADSVHGTNHGGTFADSTTVSLPARTIGAGSWVVGMATHRTQTGTTLTDATVTDYTTRSAGATSARVWGGTGGSSSSARTITVTSGPNVGRTMEVLVATATTFLGNDTDPGVNPTIAPGAATTTVGTFNLKTSSGSDTVTTATTTLSAGSSGGLFGVEITSSDNATIYCSSYNPASDTVELFGCNLPVTSASTTFNIRVKPKTHAAMPPPSGSTYSVTATINSITGTNQTSGADTTSDTVTIDNASPNGATVVSGTAGDQKVTLNWTTSDSGDFDTTSGSVVYRWASGSAGSETPDEGTTPSMGGTDGTATVACVISSAGSAAQTKIDGSGGSAGCTTDVLINGQQYTYVAFQRDTNGNYDVGASIGTFTPAAASLTFTIDTSSVTFVTTITPGTPVSTSSVLTVNTNNSAGYNIKIERASSTETLFLTTDPSTRIADNPNGNNWTAPAATSTAGPSAVWTDGTTKGLGFRVKQTGTAVNTYSSTWWGTSDASANALYSGISTSTLLQKIADTTLGSGSDEKTTVEYRVDVAGTQKSGAYTSSPIIYTALAN